MFEHQRIREGSARAVALAALLAAAAGARAAAPPPARADVEAALRKPDGELTRLGADAAAEPVLIAIADDRAADTSLRARAVAALAYARTARVHTFLENLVLRKM